MARKDLVDVHFKPRNKEKRQALHIRAKKSKELAKRDFRLRRKRHETQNPQLRSDRQQKNVPVTIDQKRRWDEVDIADQHDPGLGKAIDIGSTKRKRSDDEILEEDREGREDSAQKEGLTEYSLEPKLKQETSRQIPYEARSTHQIQEKTSSNNVATEASQHSHGKPQSMPREDDQSGFSEEDLESLINDSSAEDEDNSEHLSATDTPSSGTGLKSSILPPSPPSPASLIPDALACRFPTLFSVPAQSPKILVTTSLGATIHNEATLLCDLFPNSTYVPRQRRRRKSYHSLREIAKFATNRSFSTLLVLNEDRKRPHSLTAIHLPSGPTLHFAVSNWIPGKALPGHGRPSDHYPELILNNFRTPLGLLTAQFFRTLFPARPELQGRQVVTLHNQRDYILLRRHRYVFRDKRRSEKSVTDPRTGDKLKGLEDIKAGLQELGPRFTLKLRRLDKGIQRASGQEWEWKARMDKERTKFQL